MRLFGLLLVLCFSSLSACRKEQEKGRDKDILDKKELTAFLIEMYMAEARADNLPIPKDSAIKLFYPYEQKLMQKFHLVDSSLKKTYQYYGEHPKEMEEVYDALIDSLSLREQRTTHE
ncbi:MAG: DUF4296 domain-containing protein [Cyclobacteriaceae bacterium]|nr:DUF4296 domain-containing protein [Cyclobacteriaceae bacterium]